jgi:tetratricopeptide (TPR) repeat protein
LEREAETARAIQWADNPRNQIALLLGFGGTGKTSLQRKLGLDFIFSRNCPLCWPYDCAVWVSAELKTLSLLDVLREIAATCHLLEDQAELGRMPPDWLKREVKKLLEKERILVLLDNFETIADPDQIEILEFFRNLKGTSQLLISSRYSFDRLVSPDERGNYHLPHFLVPVEGLSEMDALTLIHDYLNARALSLAHFTQADLARLARVTQNNPKAILATLGLVEKGLALPQLLNDLTVGDPKADDIFYAVIDKAWGSLLTGSDKAMLMAKAFFSHPVTETVLTRMAGVRQSEAQAAIKTLRTISFFEWPQLHDPRIHTHPLAQDFARRVLRDHLDFEHQVEERWWAEYAPGVVHEAWNTPYDRLVTRPELIDDAANVLERLEKHIRAQSPFSDQAAEMFGGRTGIGYALRQWGRWDEVLRLAEMTLEFATQRRKPRLIGECALRLISWIHRERGEINQAEIYIGRAIEQNAHLQDAWLGAAIRRAQGDNLRRQGHFEAAKQAYQFALKFFSDLCEEHEIASTWLWLGGVTVELATKGLDEAIDREGKTTEGLLEAEGYFGESERCWAAIKETDPERRFDRFSIQAWKAVIARVRGELDRGRELFNSCMGQFQSQLSVARLYRELALVEHLAENKALARVYEDKGWGLFRQLGVIDSLPPHNCYRVIEQMKREGTW